MRMLMCVPCRFHVDKMSSAHVYLRLHKGQTIDDISEGVLEDCAQLVKANSIQGENNVHPLPFHLITCLDCVLCICLLWFLWYLCLYNMNVDACV